MNFVDHDLGSIEVGKLADLVAVKGNPLEDLSAASNTVYVMKNGFNHSVPEILARFKTMPVPPTQKQAQ